MRSEEHLIKNTSYSIVRGIFFEKIQLKEFLSIYEDKSPCQVYHISNYYSHKMNDANDKVSKIHCSEHNNQE